MLRAQTHAALRWININRRDRLQLVSVAGHVFSTRDNRLTVEFRPDSMNDDKIQLRYDGDLKAAEPSVIAARDRQAL